MRAGRAQLQEAYVYLRGGEAFLIARTSHPSHGLHARDRLTRCAPAAAAQSQRVAGTDRRGGTARLHPGAAGAVLEERPRQSAGRARQGQEAARQARGGKRSATGSATRRACCDAAEKTRAEAPRWYAADVKSEGGDRFDAGCEPSRGVPRVQWPR